MAKFLEIPDNIWDNEVFKKIIKKLVYVVFIMYFIAIFTYIGNDDRSLSTTKLSIYLIAIIFPLVVFAYLIFSNIEDKKYFIILIVMAVILLFTLLRNILPSFDDFLKKIGQSFVEVTELPPLSKDVSFLVVIFTKLLLVCISLVFLSILFNIGFNESFRQRGKMGILLYAIFFIPCLISDYIKYLFNELKTTPQVVYALIGLEIFLIALYFLIPKIASKIIFKKSNRILKKPMFLYNKKEVAGAEPFYNNTADYKDMEKKFNVSGTDDEDAPNKSLLRNYTVSMWATVNSPNMAPEEEGMIFRVGRDLGTISNPDYPQCGAPYIACKGNGKWKFVFSNNVLDLSGNIDQEKLEKVSIETELPFQRWNYLVFNYYDNYVDLFVNGELHETRSLGNFLPIYTHDQVICVGSDGHKLHGAICEVRVHSEKLGLSEIAQSYNLLKLKNPPVNNLP